VLDSVSIVYCLVPDTLRFDSSVGLISVALQSVRSVIGLEPKQSIVPFPFFSLAYKMDALKKFLSNKKADKKFKAAGPGHKLTESPASSPSNRAAQSPRKHGGSPAGTSAGVQERGPAEPSAERRAAAAAALARVEKQRSTSNPNDMLSSRQHKFIKGNYYYVYTM
jgi:hypothetical protein